MLATALTAHQKQLIAEMKKSLIESPECAFASCDIRNVDLYDGRKAAVSIRLTPIEE